MGVTRGPALERPATRLDGAPEGAMSDDGQILATYCHGLFDNPPALTVLLEWAGFRPEIVFNPNERRERDIDRLADAVEQNLRLDLLAEWLPFLRTPDA
jgi:adenosylcobyric acid synthase